MTKEEFYSRALSFDEVGEQVDIFKKEKTKYEQEIEKLHSIIKEAREYIENEWNCNFSEICKKNPQKVLEILDKENKQWK